MHGVRSAGGRLLHEHVPAVAGQLIDLVDGEVEVRVEQLLDTGDRQVGEALL